MSSIPNGPSFLSATSVGLSTMKKEFELHEATTNDQNYKKTINLFTSWVNQLIGSEKLTVRDLNQDLADGFIFSIMLEKLTKERKVDWKTTTHLKIKDQNMTQIIKFIEQHFDTKQDEQTWTMEGLIHQDHSSALHLLWLIANQYAKHLDLPRSLSVAVMKEERHNNQVVKKNIVVTKIWSDWYCQPISNLSEGTNQVIEFEDNNPVSNDIFNDEKKLQELEETMISFVNEEVGSMLTSKQQVDSSWILDGLYDGSVLLLLIASLGDFFLAPSTFYLEPQTLEEKQKNLNLVFYLMQEMGMNVQYFNTDQFINKEKHIVLKCLYSILTAMTS